MSVSMSSHIIRLTSIDAEFQSRILESCTPHDIAISPTTLEYTHLDHDTTILGVFVDSNVDKKIIDSMPHLKHIATFSTGYDHIDISYAHKKKITVSNVPTYGENTVAEHALGLLLSLSRKLYPSIKRVKEGRHDYHGLQGFDIKGKTIGVIGTGHIGIHFIQLLRGFEARILAYDAFPKKQLEKEYGFSYASLDRVLQESDVISLHAPLLPSTRHIIDTKAVKKMHRGIYLINTARGGLIDPAALLYGLQDGTIAGAGLDVLEEELVFKTPENILSLKKPIDIRQCLIENAIIDHPNTIITPHNAFNSVEALNRIIDTALTNIKNFIAGTPSNLIK
jgi:D-lactate dehydrogenase